MCIVQLRFARNITPIGAPQDWVGEMEEGRQIPKHTPTYKVWYQTLLVKNFFVSNNCVDNKDRDYSLFLPFYGASHGELACLGPYPLIH